MSGRSVEDAIQAELVRVAREKNMFVFHVPNGGQRSAREGMNFKRIGVMAGIPDLIFLFKGARVVFVEIKTLKGSLSPVQKVVHKILDDFGFDVRTAKGGVQGIEIINELEVEYGKSE